MSRHRRFSSSLVSFCVFFALCSFASGQDFSIVVLPDTQNEAQFFPQVMNSQTTWIENNADALNIQMVLGVGDIVNDGAVDAQQQNADAAIRVLDNAGIPYQLAIGNHDYDNADPKAGVWLDSTNGLARRAMPAKRITRGVFLPAVTKIFMAN